MKSLHRFRFFLRSRNALLAVVLAGASLSPAPRIEAASIYSYSLDTTALSGTSGSLVFDLIDGDGAIDNTVTVSALATNGTFSDPSGFILTDLLLLNTVFRDLTLGTFLGFTLEFTENFDPLGAFPDSLAVSLLNAARTTSLVTTTDPFGLNALLAVEPGVTAIESYAGTLTARQPPTMSVPDSGSSLALLAVAIVGLIAFFRRRNVSVA